MTNNELSRRVMEILKERKKPMKFQDLVEAIGLNARTVYKNLFYLEEHEYVQLSTSYQSEAVYPLIHLVRLRKKSAELLEDPEGLEELFPLTDTSRDHASHIPPELSSLTYREVLSVLGEETQTADMQDKERAKWAKKIKDMMGHPLAGKKVKLRS